MTTIFRVRHRRNGQYYDDDTGEFDSDIGKLWTDEVKAQRSYDKIALMFHRGGLSFYEFYMDTELVSSTLYDVGSLVVKRRMTEQDDDGR